jgi:hypothetical protein
MALENEILPFLQWLLPTVNVGMGALLKFFAVSAILAAIGFFISYLYCAARYGPAEGFYIVARIAAGIIGDDLPSFSLRRTYAVARLAIQESIRRKILIAFAVFVVILLFAGLFLDQQSDNPARIYLDFVFGTANFMICVLAIFLSTFSLPSDIKNRTIYTVVTKPVRALEIVVGRIVGFSAIGTGLLVVMGLTSWLFVVRNLSHEHSVEISDELKAQLEQLQASGKSSSTIVGVTSRDSHHRHEFTLDSNGLGNTDIRMGHWHPVSYDKDSKTIRVGPHRGMLLARVPKYGQLTFLDRQGHPGQGVSVGKEWTYRSYLEGQTQARAIWRFDDLQRDDFQNGLTLELNLRIFRTHKGDIKQGVQGEIEIFNPKSNAVYLRSVPRTFTAIEFIPQELTLERKIKAIDRNNSVKEVDLFDDLTDNGKLEIRIRCAHPGQYFGMAKGDLFIRSGDRPFTPNFVKGFVGIWLQLVMVTAFGVMFSTVLTAPVALLATISNVVLGFFAKSVSDILTGESQGGGPVEATIRIFRQSNLTSELELPALAEGMIKRIDNTLLGSMQLLSEAIPNFRSYLESAGYVAYGYDITGNILMQQSLIAAACVFVVSLIGFVLLKTREIGA